MKSFVLGQISKLLLKDWLFEMKGSFIGLQDKHCFYITKVENGKILVQHHTLGRKSLYAYKNREYCEWDNLIDTINIMADSDLSCVKFRFVDAAHSINHEVDKMITSIMRHKEYDCFLGVLKYEYLPLKLLRILCKHPLFDETVKVELNRCKVVGYEWHSLEISNGQRVFAVLSTERKKTINELISKTKIKTS